MVIKQTYTLEYIWIGGNGELRGKTRILSLPKGGNSIISSPQLEEIPEWNFDGSSTDQAVTEQSEVRIRAKAIFRDPFRLTAHYTSFIVLCDTYTIDGKPHPTNTRYKADQIFSRNGSADLDSMFGIEQEFFIVDPETRRPLGFPKESNNFPEQQGKYYCGVGVGKVFGREIIEEAFQNCLRAELSLTGLNFEVAPGQCEFQVCDHGIAAADHLIVSRYILERTLEKHGLALDHSPKPVKGDWNGSGCHVNFSTEQMRAEGGYEIIKQAMEKLAKKHKEHIDVYGEGNHERLTGKHETSDINAFNWGVANRATSVRIPADTEVANRGYFEDRRPSSSMDPYLVTSKLLETCCYSE